MAAAAEDDDVMMRLRFTPEQLAEMKEAFELFDVSNNGYIGYEELGNCLSTMGFSPDPVEIKAMIDDVDTDGQYH